MIHWDHVCLVLARAWHVEILRPLVKLHAEGELCLFLSNSVCVVWVSRVGEIEIAWDVILWAWHSHELNLLLFLLLHLSDLLGQISVFLADSIGGAFTTSVQLAKRTAFSFAFALQLSLVLYSHIDWFVRAWA